jgi:hypothetical protein
MPTVLRVGPYSFVFFSSVALAKNRGFAEHELNAIETSITQNRQELMEAWHDFFDA